MWQFLYVIFMYILLPTGWAYAQENTLPFDVLPKRNVISQAGELTFDIVSNKPVDIKRYKIKPVSNSQQLFIFNTKTKEWIISSSNWEKLPLVEDASILRIYANDTEFPLSFEILDLKTANKYSTREFQVSNEDWKTYITNLNTQLKNFNSEGSAVLTTPKIEENSEANPIVQNTGKKSSSILAILVSTLGTIGLVWYKMLKFSHEKD